MKKVLPGIIIFLLLIYPLYSQEEELELDNVPTWILYERGCSYLNEGEYGIALTYFREAQLKKEVFPEVEYKLGKIFEAEGELILAEKQYQKALESAAFLYIPEDKYAILYDMAAIYFVRNEIDSYEDTLRRIIEDELGDNEYIRNLYDKFYETVHDKGVNRLLFLYRNETSFALKAYGDLGVLYYYTGDYKMAVKYLSINIVSIFTTIIAILRKKDFEFEFTDISACLERSRPYSFLTEFIGISELFRGMYYLALSLHEDKNDAYSRDILQMIAELDKGWGRKWIEKSKRQYYAPFRESEYMIYN